MRHENFWSLLAKKLSGDATDSELAELEQLLRANPELHYSVQPLTDIWQTAGIADIADNATGQEAFERHVRRMEDLGIEFTPVQPDQSVTSRGRRRRIFRASAVGLSVVVVVILGVRALFPEKTPELPPSTPDTKQHLPLSEISTRYGSKTTLLLPDGTKVWLNAGSKLTYDSAFGKSLREVTLSGEGYFDVVKNKEKPFIIHASRMNVTVLGTEFDVKSYPSDKTSEASLIRGSIEVTLSDQPRKKVILKPNEKIVVDNYKFANQLAQTVDNPRRPSSIAEIPKSIAVKNLTYENKTGEVIETSWVENRLVFQDESFEEIARKLERWYGVTIRFGNEKLKENHLTGSFTNETIRQALEALKFTAEFSYAIDNNNNIRVY
jgi:ferric-dicitrate binding protein FerR (iron transport regulator)